MLTAATSAHASWYQAKSKHFIICADASSDELRNYATNLERFDQAVRMARAMEDPALTDSGRLNIYIIRDPAKFGELTGWSSIVGEYASRASGSYAFVAKMKGQRIWDMNSNIILFHEYAHHMMLQSWAAPLPTWVSEGFAEFLSTAKVNDDGTVTLGAPANHRSAGVHAFHRDLTLSEMLASNQKYLTGWQLEIIYARGWLLTHYLTFEPSRRGQLDRYIAGIQKGETPISSARAAFGDLGKLDSELSRYATAKQITGVVLRTDPAKLGPISIRPLGEAEAAMMPIRIRSDFGVSPQNSGMVAARARKLAEPYPADAFAQGTLAEAEYDAENFQAADAAADRALAADPENVHALIYKGRSEMELAKKSGNADWSKIRSWFAKANRRDTENAEPLMLYYDSFVKAGMRPSESATRGLFYALVLAPQDVELRLMAVRQRLLDGQSVEAKQALIPLAYDPHESRSRDTAEQVMKEIEASKTPAAVALIEAWQKQLNKSK
jgi:tetratricopeptide (TPR) repeat protein